MNALTLRGSLAALGPTAALSATHAEAAGANVCFLHWPIRGQP